MRTGLVWVTTVLLGAVLGFVSGRSSTPATVSDTPATVNPPREDELSSKVVATRPADANPAKRDAHATAAQAQMPKNGDASTSTTSPSAVNAQSNALTKPDVATALARQSPLFSSSDRTANHNSKSDLATLHKAYRVTCQFDPGVSALVGDDAFSTGSANWQGGQMIYDVIDGDTGRASLGGSVGATGSSTGTAEVQMIKSNAGLSFSAVLPNGDLLVTTVFATRNARGAFLSVMSTHGAATGHVASQFYGACDVM